jgi:Holliday junction resolvase-like predicted endonuclease
MKTSWQVATAAEAFAAAQFARCGWNVSVQYGANQPEYDLVAEDRDRMLKVSVKGSKDGGWGLTQSFKKNTTYHGAVDTWLAKHSKRTVFCLVQFKGTSIETLPRMYLATPQEIADWLKKAGKGRGDTILHEKHVWTTRGCGAGTIDAIPESWIFTEKRLEEIVKKTEPVGAPDAEKHRARSEKVVPSPTPRPPRG